jgi:hypothetical protein
MRIDRFEKRSLRQNPVCIELLETRQLLSGNANGNYNGINNVSVDGKTLPADTTVRLVDDGNGRKRLQIFTPVPDTPVEEEEDEDADFHSSSAIHITGNAPFGAITPAASHTFLVGVLPQAAGGGVVQIEDNHLMTIDGTFAPGKLFYPISYSFSGAKVSSGAAVPQSAEAISVVKPLTTKKKKNPLLGIYKGTITDTQHGLSYGVGVTEYRNKNGNLAITATIAVPNFGTVTIASVNHPHSSGSFDLALGGQVTDGILSGHITHTGKLVLTVRTIGLSVTTGTLKRLA